MEGTHTGGDAQEWTGTGTRGCPWLCVPMSLSRCPRGWWRSHTPFEQLRDALWLHQRAALSARAASSLPRLFLSLFIIFPPPIPALEMKRKPLQQGQRGWQGEEAQLGVRGGLSITLRRQGMMMMMLRGALGSAIGCSVRSQPALGVFMGRGQRVRTRSSAGPPMCHAMVDFSEKYLER